GSGVLDAYGGAATAVLVARRSAAMICIRRVSHRGAGAVVKLPRMSSATPILDGEILPSDARSFPHRPLNAASLGIAAIALAVAFSSASLRQWLRGMVANIFAGLDVWSMVWLWLVVVAVIAVHENGHVVGGLMAGFRFNGMAIGPLRIHRPFRVSLGGGSWRGGWASMLPARNDRLRARMAILVA